MVSLNTQHGRSGGGISFDDRSFTGADEVTQENTPLIDSIDQPYRPIRTTGFIVIHILLTMAFMASIVLFPSTICVDNSYNNTTVKCNHHSGYNIALYIHAGAYMINLGFDRLYHHYQDLSRLDGYLEFYRQTRNLRRTPLFIISTGNAILVALIELLENFRNDLVKLSVKLYPWHFLVMLSSIEVLIILIALLWYLVLTIKFNQKRARPDATHDDLLSSFVTSQTSANEIGFRDETYRENVLEKQADLIRYLRERNELLGRLVLQFKTQVDTQPNHNL
ncbi:unnamed protein product [Rotaria socialis]|uniref:Transmembrane protein 192 n=1 Tax=Rotaria socialis TaxID=392032 RepID=A0A819ZD15_9BILA|nr:unnamed protein product [Rotaria socialis]CAF3306930.1 unnamed protein product [Rotaria socialis]CAF3569821.1 unnamed protein product [Rotaria socialis]CAF4175130.1 unnamed protein product [Rotaria socialis]CAF4303556.1 unnamed protein product [Rotaria socialis]